MPNKVYFITFDATDPSLDYGRLKNFLKAGTPDIENWRNHIPNVFLINTHLDADAISDLIRPFTGRALFGHGGSSGRAGGLVAGACMAMDKNPVAER